MSNVTKTTVYSTDCHNSGEKTIRYYDAIDGVTIKNGDIVRITWPNGSITYNDAYTRMTINDVDMCTREVSIDAYTQIDYEGFIVNVSLADAALQDVRHANIKCTKLS